MLALFVTSVTIASEVQLIKRMKINGATIRRNGTGNSIYYGIGCNLGKAFSIREECWIKNIKYGTTQNNKEP